jgi:hypothetical protein
VETSNADAQSLLIWSSVISSRFTIGVHISGRRFWVGNDVSQPYSKANLRTFRRAITSRFTVRPALKAEKADSEFKTFLRSSQRSKAAFARLPIWLEGDAPNVCQPVIAPCQEHH